MTTSRLTRSDILLELGRLQQQEHLSGSARRRQARLQHKLNKLNAKLRDPEYADTGEVREYLRVKIRERLQIRGLENWFQGPFEPY